MRSYQTSDGRNGQRMSGSSSRRQNYDRADNNITHGSRSKPPPRDPQPIRKPEREPQPQTRTEPQRGSGIFENLASNPSGLIKSVLNFIPPGIYDRETKKLFGIFTAEDLFLAALILMLADSDDNDDTALLIALVYILLG